MQSDLKLKKNERERKKKEREREFKYLLTLILTGGSYVNLITLFFLSGNH